MQLIRKESLQKFLMEKKKTQDAKPRPRKIIETLGGGGMGERGETERKRRGWWAGTVLEGNPWG